MERNRGAVMSKPRQKMSIETRAKQFMPFAAVGGLDEALEKKLQEYLMKKEKESKFEEEIPVDPE